MLRRAALALVVTGGIACHVTDRIEVTRVVGRSRVPRPDPPRALPATLMVTGDGELRFVEPLRCTADEIVELETTEVVHVRPNLATVIVGITASSLGALGLFLGATDDSAGTSPLIFGGAGLLAAGVPLMVGPWFGNRSDYHPAGVQRATRSVHAEPCGQRGVTASAATLSVAGLRVTGAVDGDGVFAVSPFEIVDAFDTTTRGLDVSAELVAPGGRQSVRAALGPDALGRGRAAFLQRLGVDAAVEPMRKVPRLEPGAVRVVRAGASLRIALAIGNAGPGDAYAVRGRVATAAADIDGRLLYFGRIPARTTITREIAVPLGDGAAALAGPLDLAIELIDAHGTAPDAPVRFRGTVSREDSEP
jgi:hypothetical protein